MAATAIVLDFEKHRLHALQRGGLIWFVLAEVCELLGIANPWDAASRLKKNEKGLGITETLGGPQRTTIISEAGLYRLAYTSRKPIAERFVDWLVNDVLPEIRRTGSYHGGSAPLDALIGSLQPELDLSPANDDNVRPLAPRRESNANQRHLDCISELGESPNFDADLFEPAPVFRDLGDYMDADAPLPRRITEEWQHQHEGKTYLMSLRSIAGIGTPLRVRIVRAERIPGIEREMLAPIFLPPNEAGERLLVRFEADTPRAVIDAALIYVNPEICWRSKETLDALLA